MFLEASRFTCQFVNDLSTIGAAIMFYIASELLYFLNCHILKGVFDKIAKGTISVTMDCGKTPCGKHTPHAAQVSAKAFPDETLSQIDAYKSLRSILFRTTSVGHNLAQRCLNFS